MSQIVNFFNHPFFIIMGGLATLIAIFGFIAMIFLVIKGILPVWYKLGIGLSKRKIAIFADAEFDSLKNLLIDSGIFNKKNIVKIDKGSIKKAESISLLLVHYNSFRDKINEIISIKHDSDALIIYAPQEEGSIEKDILKNINSQRNAIIVNFRGRLLNDVLVSMITTGYKS